MTIEALNVASGPYYPNGATTSFPFDFQVSDPTEVSVEIDGVTVSSSLFSVTVDPDGRGRAVFFVAPASGTLFVVSNPYFGQRTDFTNQGPFYQADLNSPIDRSAQRDLWLKDRVSRAPVLPRAGPDLSSVLGKYPVVGADGNWQFTTGSGGDSGLRADLAVSTAGKGSALIRHKSAILKDILDYISPVTANGVVSGSVLDQSALLQAAIDALPATGGIILVPFMVYANNIRINGTARDKQNVILRGTGIGSGLIVPNGAWTNLTRANLIDGDGAIGCRVENMTLDGNRSNQSVPGLVDGPDYEKFNLVYLEGSQDCAVADCNILNAPVLGVCPGAPWTGKTGADRTRIERNIFKGCSVPVAAMRQRKSFIDSNVIYGTSETYAIVVDEFSVGNVVSNNDISDTLDGAIFLFRATDNQVLGNRVTNSLVSILLSDASNDNLIANNDCDTSSNSHIKIINGCLRNTVRDNVLETASQYCIVCEAGTGGSSYTIISGNRCRLASFSNIAIFNAAFTIIEDNYCYEAVGSGIYVSGACDWSEINDNYCYNNSTGSVNDAGIRLVAQNNITVENNKCFDSQGTKTQNWGIRCNESFVGTVALLNNDVRQNKTAGMAITGGTPIVKGNLGWITEAVGQVALGAAATAITVTHGMDMQPDFRTVRVTFLDTTVRNSKVMYVANVGATTFEIRVDAAPGTATNIVWEARQSI